MLFSMETPLSPDISPDISGGWALAFRLYPFTARPPLAVAWTPGEVAPWDWTRGVSPWAPTLYDPSRFTPKPLPEGLTYPRLVRAQADMHHPGPVKLPLYPKVAGLGRVAQKHPPRSPKFAQKAVEVAQQVGLLDPFGTGGWADSLQDWHRFALEVRARLDFLREYRLAVGSPEERLMQASEIVGEWGATFLFSAVRGDTAKIYGEEKPPSLRNIAASITAIVWPHILSGVDWTHHAWKLMLGWEEPVLTAVSSWHWVMLEIAQLYASEEKLRFCPNPNCGLPFLPKRRTQETCGRDACVKWLHRERKKHGLGPKRPRFRGLYGNSSG